MVLISRIKIWGVRMKKIVFLDVDGTLLPEVADYVTDDSDKDGIENLLKYLGLI